MTNLIKVKKKANMTLVIMLAFVILFVCMATTILIMNKAKLGVSVTEDSKDSSDTQLAIDLAVAQYKQIVADRSAILTYSRDRSYNTESGTYGNPQGDYNYVTAVESDFYENLSTKTATVGESGQATLELDTLQSSILSQMDSLGCKLDSLEIYLLFSSSKALTVTDMGKTKFPSIPENLSIEATTVQNPEPANLYIKAVKRTKQYLSVYQVTNDSITLDLDSAVTSLTDTKEMLKVNCNYNVGGVNIVLSTSSIKTVSPTTQYVATAIDGNLNELGLSTTGLAEARQSILNMCVKYSGIDYKYSHDMDLIGGEPPKSLDCSSYVWKVYNAAGFSVPLLTTSGMVANENWVWIPFKDIQPGDILVGKGSSTGHTMIYAGKANGLYYVYEAPNHKLQSGLYTRTGKDWAVDVVTKPDSVYDNKFYAYRYKGFIN